MTFPALLLGLIIALLVGGLFHIWSDGGAGRLLFYLVLSIFGFFAGQWIGSRFDWVFLQIGPLNLGMAVLGSIISLGMGFWLSRVEIRRSAGEDDSV